MITRRTANTIYRAYKQGQLDITKKFANAMYKVVGMDDYALRHVSQYMRDVEYKAGLAFLYIVDDFGIKDEDRRYELAQAVIDGKSVEQVVTTHIIREVEITQDVYDNPEKYDIDPIAVLFYNVGETFVEEENVLEYVIK